MSPDHWYPVGRERDIPSGHLFHTRLHDTELMLWRDTQGHLHCWENRCPHRSVRLTIGRHLGDSVKCRYHGWEFTAQGGQCVRVPAHPGESPAARIAVRTYPVLRQGGLVWVTTGEPVTPPALAAAATCLALRAIRIEAGIETVATTLAAHVWQDAGVRLRVITGHWLELVPVLAGGRLDLVLQPAGAGVTIVHGVLTGTQPFADPTAILRELDWQLCTMRDALEVQSA